MLDLISQHYIAWHVITAFISYHYCIWLIAIFRHYYSLWMVLLLPSFCLLEGYCAQIISFSFSWGLFVSFNLYLLFLLYEVPASFNLYLLFLYMRFFPPLIYILHHILMTWSVRRTLGHKQTQICFAQTDFICYLAGNFNNILFNWAIIIFNRTLCLSLLNPLCFNLS